ncbi:rhodanese-like domain-containing protein [Streptomyces sp. NPDC054841]
MRRELRRFAAPSQEPIPPHGLKPGASWEKSGKRPVGIDELLERVREGLDRVGPRAAFEAAADGALLVDIRYAALRDRDGLIPGALVVERNELEWRLDPLGSHRAPEATSHDLQVVVVCNEGYASSLAAASLRQLGLHRATDLVGGFQAWRAEGLPVRLPVAEQARL